MQRTAHPKRDRRRQLSGRTGTIQIGQPDRPLLIARTQQPHPRQPGRSKLPDGIDVDVEGMQIGASIHASDLTLPEGTTLAVDPETLILHVLAAPTAEQLEADLGETEGAETPEPAGETDAEPAEGNEG